VTVGVPRAGLADPELLDLMAAADAVGIDSPFGWPEFVTEHLGEYARTGAWPLRPEDADAREWILRLRFRETDRAVHRQVGIWPLSVSSDLIAVCAWRCAALLHQHAQAAGVPLDRTGERTRVFEVYPAAALAAWGLPFRGYKATGPAKGAAARERREAIVAGLTEPAPWVGQPAVADALVGSHDLLDAFVSALVARAAAMGSTVGPQTDEERRLAPTEGWIHVPQPGGLARLA
jgi:predicted nuclease with RNAse H fold